MIKAEDFSWKTHPQAEQMLFAIVEDFKVKNPAIAELEGKLNRHICARLPDWLDHLLLPDTEENKGRLLEHGFVTEGGSERPSYRHPGAIFPKVILTGARDEIRAGLAIRVESVAEFIQVNGVAVEISGVPLGQYRQAELCSKKGVALLVVERRDTISFSSRGYLDNWQNRYLRALEIWQTAPRRGQDDPFGNLSEAVVNMTGLVGQDMAAYIVCEAERGYWMSKNLAGRFQKLRQDRLGLGWANLDHHTFRSSRKNFLQLIKIFKQLGFQERERFYAGKDAGWGAQVMEQERAGITLFLDVDLEPVEISIDFESQPLAETDKLGTVGLWCALHGDSILEAGLHHLAARYDFGAMQRLKEGGISFMSPFSELPFLKQAFSKGEVWAVPSVRINLLLAQKLISKGQADKFMVVGAVGSHLENIQRDQGFKGFNQNQVSSIIKRLDPRKDSC